MAESKSELQGSFKISKENGTTAKIITIRVLLLLKIMFRKEIKVQRVQSVLLSRVATPVHLTEPLHRLQMPLLPDYANPEPNPLHIHPLVLVFENTSGTSRAKVRFLMPSITKKENKRRCKKVSDARLFFFVLIRFNAML